MKPKKRKKVKNEKKKRRVAGRPVKRRSAKGRKGSIQKKRVLPKKSDRKGAKKHGKHSRATNNRRLPKRSSKGIRNNGALRRPVNVRKVINSKRLPRRAPKVTKGRVSGATGEKGKQRKVTIAILEKQKKDLAKTERRLKHQLEKARRKIKQRERDIGLRKMAAGLKAERLAVAREWLNVAKARAESLGHRTRIAVANNRDGTSDLQLTIYDWELPYKEALFHLFAELNDSLPNLGSGIKVRVQTRISADKIEKDSKHKKRYAYLPAVNGQRAVYYNYTHPDFQGNLFFKVEYGISRLTEDGWRLVALAIDVRFDPRWMKL